MLIYSEIAQLSDKDLADKIKLSRNSLFRQKMGLKTNHLKDSHLVKILKKYIAQLLTELHRRKSLGGKVEKTSAEVSKKVQDSHAEIKKAQSKKIKTEKKVVKVEEEKEKTKAEEIENKSSKDVKVKKVEKKGLLKKMFKKEKS